MNKANDKVPGTKGVSTLVRARFGPGMLLQHEDLERLNSYTRDLSRLMFGSLFGCGVICGLVVKVALNCGKIEVTVGSGLALGCSGDPVYVPTDQKFPLDEHCDPNPPSPVWVVLCGTVKCCAPRTSLCASDDDEAPSVCTQERDGFEIRVVRERPACVCGCEEPDGNNYDPTSETTCKCVDPELACYVDHYAGKCGCHCGECSDCDCKCILLARLDRIGDTDQWEVDHRVRRFIRPVLMRDPQVEEEEQRRKDTQTSMQQQQQQDDQQIILGANRKRGSKSTKGSKSRPSSIVITG